MESENQTADDTKPYNTIARIINMCVQENGSIIGGGSNIMNIDELAKRSAAWIGLLLSKYREVLQNDKFLQSVERQADYIAHYIGK